MTCNDRNHPSPLLNPHFLSNKSSLHTDFQYETIERKYEAVVCGGSISFVDCTRGEYRSWEHGLIGRRSNWEGFY
uniref:Uncharacterized protein n=1 Tax=Populus trichocarpa TaxID=3694 RepID=A0A2K1ZVX7_POPTR